MLFDFFRGIMLGLTVALLIGPVFFTIIQTSIYRGFRSGVFLSFGVLLSDFTLIVLSYIGILGLLNSETNQVLIGLIGGALLIIFGIVTLTRKPSTKAKDTSKSLKINKPNPLTYIVKGYFMNIMNPFLLIFWITVMSVYSTKKDVETKDIIVFFMGTLSTIFVTDVIKCYIAKKIKRFITEKTLLWINRLIGLILIGFGIVLIIRVILLTDFF